MNGSTSWLRLFPILLAACAHMSPAAPEARNTAARVASVVRVESTCGTQNKRFGSGVIISERHVLTAATIVSCSGLPRVRVTYRDGNGEHQLRMFVTRENRDTGIARLEIASAERFGLGIKPPLVRQPDPGNPACVTLAARGVPATSAAPPVTCGTVASTWTVVKRMPTNDADNGAPVYGPRGMLLGIVVNRGQSALFPYTWIAPVDERWLDGIVPAAQPPAVVTARSGSDRTRASR